MWAHIGGVVTVAVALMAAALPVAIYGGIGPCFLCTSHAIPVTMRCHRDGRGIRNSAGARPHSVDQLATLNLGLKESHERAYFYKGVSVENIPGHIMHSYVL